MPNIKPVILPKNYTCLACIKMRTIDGVCVTKQLIATGKCILYDPILGRHELAAKTIGNKL